MFYQGKRIATAELFEQLGWKPIKLRSKEGLGLLNGTQFMLSFATQCILRSWKYIKWADLLACMSLDGFDGLVSPFAEPLHRIRPHKGQITTARNVRNLLADSEIAHRKKTSIQDPYSFR